MARLLPILTALLLAVAPGCRDDPGDPNQALLDDYQNPPGFFEDPLPGPDPFMEGENRIGIGLFVENRVSDFIEIDNDFSNFFIFETFPGGPLTFRIQDDTVDRVEGLFSTRIIHAGEGFLGGGVIWSEPRDMSGWTTMYVSLKSSSPDFAEIELTIQSSDGDGLLLATDYGYANDGEWHNLVIPLDDFTAAGANMGAVTAPFVMGAGAGSSGSFFKIDGLYWTDD